MGGRSKIYILVFSHIDCCSLMIIMPWPKVDVMMKKYKVWSQKCECTVSNMSDWLETDGNMFIGYFASGAGFHGLQYFGSLMFEECQFLRFLCPRSDSIPYPFVLGQICSLEQSHVVVYSSLVLTYLGLCHVP